MNGQGLRPPETGRPVFVLDVLLGIREEALRGRPLWFFFGTENAEVMWAYILGYVDACHRNGLNDEEWSRFLDWLADVKHELPEGGGWVKKYLDECGGQHGKAMMRFLDVVAEFAATQLTKDGHPSGP